MGMGVLRCLVCSFLEVQLGADSAKKTMRVSATGFNHETNPFLVWGTPTMQRGQLNRTNLRRTLTRVLP